MKLSSDDPRLTDYVLGELDEPERTEIEAAIQEDEVLRREVEDLRSFGGLLSGALSERGGSRLSAERRQAIEEALEGREHEEVLSQGSGPGAGPPPSGAGLEVGDQLGNYTLVRKISEGGMGIVYEARQGGLDRTVALKVLSKNLANDSSFLARLKKEARTAAALDHPNLVEVYEIGADRGYVFFSMQYVDGESLGDRLRREGKVSVSEALTIVGQVAQALDCAWSEGGIIHRDIKPANILLAHRGQVKLADLGLAKSVSTDLGLTDTGTSMGTPYYMAPEQGRGAKTVDCRADIYSLGVTLFHAITGQLPFQGDTPLAVMMAHAEQPLPDPLSLDPEIPAGVCQLIRKMCAKDPEDRFRTPGQFIAALAALGRVPSPAGTGSRTEIVRNRPTLLATQAYAERPRWGFRNALGVAGWVAAAICLAILGFQWTSPRLNEQELKRLFDFAVHVARTEPESHEAVIENFRQVEIEGRGTQYAMMARTEREKAKRSKRQSEAGKELESDVEALVEADRFREAIELVRKLPEDSRLALAPGKWDRALRYVERRAEARVLRLLEQAKQLVAVDELDKAKERYSQIESFELPAFESVAITGLKELERLVEEQRLKKAEALYEEVLSEVNDLVKERDYGRALALCAGLEEDVRYEPVKERIARDKADVGRAQAVLKCAMVALRGLGEGEESQVTERLPKAIAKGTPKAPEAEEPDEDEGEREVALGEADEGVNVQGAPPDGQDRDAIVQRQGKTVLGIDVGRAKQVPEEKPEGKLAGGKEKAGGQEAAPPAKQPEELEPEVPVLSYSLPRARELPTERVIALAKPSMAKLGAEGLLNLAVFSLLEGDAANAKACLAKAREAGADVSRYESDPTPFAQGKGEDGTGMAHAHYEEDGWHLDGIKVTGAYQHRAWGGTFMAQLQARGSSIVFLFDDPKVRFMTLWHSATDTGAGFQTTIHISVNGQDVVREYRVPGHRHDRYEHGPIGKYNLPVPESWDISRFVREGDNEIKITLSEKAPTLYWLKEVWLSQRKLNLE